MPTIFKILVFLLLQQGAKLVKDISGPATAGLFNWEALAVARPMILTVEADESAVNELVNLCSIAGKEMQFRQESLLEGRVKAEMHFTGLFYTDRERIMKMFSPGLVSRVQYQWLEL